MEALEVARLRRLLKEATPLPWEESYWDGEHSVHNSEVAIIESVARQPDTHQAGRNAALIVGAVNALPELLDMIERHHTVCQKCWPK